MPRIPADRRMQGLESDALFYLSWSSWRVMHYFTYRGGVARVMRYFTYPSRVWRVMHHGRVRFIPLTACRA